MKMKSFLYPPLYPPLKLTQIVYVFASCYELNSGLFFFELQTFFAKIWQFYTGHHRFDRYTLFYHVGIVKLTYQWNFYSKEILEDVTENMIIF